MINRSQLTLFLNLINQLFIIDGKDQFRAIKISNNATHFLAAKFNYRRDSLDAS